MKKRLKEGARGGGPDPECVGGSNKGGGYT